MRGELHPHVPQCQCGEDEPYAWRVLEETVGVDESWEHPRWGINFEWLAVDPTGCVALFDSAGYGAVPPIVFQHVEHVDDAVDMVDGLPMLNKAIKKVRSEGGDHTYWSNIIIRGLYVYDWELWHGPYQRLTSPVKLVSVDDLPPSIRSAAQLVKVSVPFSSVRSFTTAMLP